MNYYERIQKSIDYIESNLEDRIDLNRAAQEAYMSQSSFYRLFFALVGYSVKEYIRLSAYTGLSGRQFRRHPDIKPETSGHLIDQLDFTLKLIVVQCFSYHHKSVNLISLIVFSAITSRMDFFESRARIYVL